MNKFLDGGAMSQKNADQRFPSDEGSSEKLGPKDEVMMNSGLLSYLSRDKSKKKVDPNTGFVSKL